MAEQTPSETLPVPNWRTLVVLGTVSMEPLTNAQLRALPDTAQQHGLLRHPDWMRAIREDTGDDFTDLLLYRPSPQAAVIDAIAITLEAARSNGRNDLYVREVAASDNEDLMHLFPNHAWPDMDDYSHLAVEYSNLAARLSDIPDEFYIDDLRF